MAETIYGVRGTLSPIISRLIKESRSNLGKDTARKLEDLQTLVIPQLQWLIVAAERGGHMHKLEHWLKIVTDTIYDVEDELDEHRCQLMEQQMNRSTVLCCPPSIPKFISNAFNSSKEKNLNRSLDRLEYIVSKGWRFFEFLDKTRPSNAHRITVSDTSQDPPRTVFGRDQECKDIEDLLIEKPVANVSESSSSTAPCYSVVAIVGIGGVGKTTLAQLVFQATRISDHFDTRMWISVSHNFDELQIAREMAEELSGMSYSHVDDIYKLGETIENNLSSKKFLIVLDDVWSEERVNTDQWDERLRPLLRPLRAGKVGSKILLTTRSIKAAQDVGAAGLQIYHLKGLEPEHMLSLFKHHAFSRVATDIDQPLMQELNEKGWQIAQELKGSPLLAVAVGMELSITLDVRKWEKFSYGNMFRIARETLLWSYQRLPPHLQRCFSYCSLFPHGHKFQHDELVRLWEAEGFLVPPKDGNKKIEEVGKEYLDELVSYSFFQLEDGNSKSYLVHDLMHDLADQVGKVDCFRVEGDVHIQIPPYVRHLSILNPNLSMNIEKRLELEKLHTLIFLGGPGTDLNNYLNKMLMKFKKLRILNLSGCHVERLPQSIGNLKHLHYLNLYGTRLKQLPSSVSRLYHLQCLDLRNCQLKSLPRDLKNLINLRPLDVDDELLPAIREIWRLPPLQE